MAYYVLGVQQSGSKFKIAAFEKALNKYKLYALGNVSVNIDENKTTEDLKNWISTNLSEAEKITAVLAIPESNIFLKEITLPKINDAQVGEAARWELLSDTPIPLESAVYDWKKLSQTASNINVLTFLMKEQTSEIFVSIFERAGVQLLAIEPSSSAFIRTAKEDFSKNTLLVTTDDDEINLFIIKNAAPVFTSSFKIQSQKTTKIINESILKEIVSESKKIITYWEKKNESKIEQIVISGGIDEKYSNILKELNKDLGLEVLISKDKKFNKFSIAGFEKNALAGYYTAIGTAAKITSKDRLNLLPSVNKTALSREEKIVDQIRNASRFSIMNLVLIAVSAIIFAAFTFWNTSLHSDIERTKSFITNHPAQAQIDSFKMINQKVDGASRLLNEQKDSGERLKMLASYTPSGVRLTNIDFYNLKEESWKIQGEGDRGEILAFFEKLESESGATKVEMPYSNFSQKEGVFEIIVTW